MPRFLGLQQPLTDPLGVMGVFPQGTLEAGKQGGTATVLEVVQPGASLPSRGARSGGLLCVGAVRRQERRREPG